MQSSIPNLQSTILNRQSPIDRNRHNPTESYTILQKFVCAHARARQTVIPPSLIESRHTPVSHRVSSYPRLSSSLVIPPSHVESRHTPVPRHSRTLPRHSRTLPRHSREGGNLGGVDAGTPTRSREPTLPRHSRTPSRHSREGGNLGGRRREPRQTQPESQRA